jgi:hypothetical protein
LDMLFDQWVKKKGGGQMEGESDEEH